jgi:para-aminobenzoate synthetase component 1
MMRRMAATRQTTGMPIGASSGTPGETPEATGADVLAIADGLRDLPGLAVLDSARAGRRSRWTYVTADPLAVVSGVGPRGATFAPARALLARMGGPAGGAGGRVEALGGEAGAESVTAVLPPFTGGLVGFVGYDVGRELERVPSIALDDQPLPPLSLALHDWVVAVDRRAGRVLLCGRPVDGDAGRLEARLAAVLARLAGVRAAGTDVAVPPPLGTSDLLARRPFVPAGLRFTSGLDRDAWVDRVERVREAIAGGELYQANLARRLEAPFAGDPWPLFRVLRTGDPATFAAYLDVGPDPTAGSPRAIVSASPEPFLSVDAHGRVESDPIKGTRPRGRTRGEDRALAADLLGSEKDRAENVMIVDVLRNDLGRVCRPGSVRVPRLCRLERTEAVQHLVSTVVGRLAPGRDAFDLLAAAFPGGSITGAPKIRAMRLIEELEPVRRGPYCGMALWLGPDGAMGSSILIRTFVADGRRLTLHVGGGITRRSDPDAEWEETRVKARGPLRAIGAEEA